MSPSGSSTGLKVRREAPQLGLPSCYVPGTTIIYAKEKLCFANPCQITGLTQHTTYLVR